ncbi:hypothetical protein XU18_0895 [Perkinsela sp. CCAP 1560/4]|nr:hypothetical protein XU18_0895 [Perkinsela sp. CCAP 1560/4]|eukprot:KNH08609.1 hypothetical protein XU18_0895 [Perkinsela sp. CCAP 1560/4]
MTDAIELGSALDIALVSDIGVASSSDLAFTLARAVWCTSEHKDTLLETILRPFLSPSEVNGWQKTFLEALLGDMPHTSNDHEAMNGSVDPLEKSLNVIFQLLPSNVTNKTFFRRSEPKSAQLAEILHERKVAKLSTRTVGLEDPRTVERYEKMVLIVLYTNDIVANFNDDVVISISNLLANMKSLDGQSSLRVDTLVLSSKGRNFCLLDPTQQKILIILFCMQTILRKIKAHVHKFTSSCDMKEQDICHLGQKFADLIAVDILKCVAIFSSDTNQTWSCNNLSFEDHLRDFQGILLHGVPSSPAQPARLTALAKGLDSAFGIGPLGFFIELLVAFGLASYKDCVRKEPAVKIHFVMHPACAEIFQVSWSAASSFQNGTNCYPLSNSVEKSTNQLVSIFKKREKYLEGVLLNKPGSADPSCEKAIPHFLIMGREQTANEIRMIVEQSFQVFAIFPACHVKNEAVNVRELVLDDIPSFDKMLSVPLLILGQFVDLCSIASNGGTLLNQEGKSSRQVLVIGNIKKSSVMRGLRLGMTTDGMLDFLNRYSRTPPTNSKVPPSSAKEKYLSKKLLSSAENSQKSHLPDIVIRQIRYWGTEARRLTVSALKTVMCLDAANICHREVESEYPHQSFWWRQLSSGVTDGNACDSQQFYEEIPIIIGGLSDAINQDESGSRILKAESETSDPRKAVKRRKEKATEKYSLPCTYSNEYGDEILQKIKRRINYQYFVQVCFESEEERDAAFGESHIATPESLKSNIPHQEHYRFVAQLGPLTFLAVIDALDNHLVSHSE